MSFCQWIRIVVMRTPFTPSLIQVRSFASKSMEPHEQVAIAFASALVDGNFVRARTYLDPALKRQMTPQKLQKMFFGMFRGYADGEAQSAEFGISGTDRRSPSDIGWAYVSNLGEDFNEAVSVTVA